MERLPAPSKRRSSRHGRTTSRAKVLGTAPLFTAVVARNLAQRHLSGANLAAKDSPGYEEHKKQKLEATAQHERRLQAQALVSCLEGRQNAMAAMFNAGQMPQ